MQSSTDRNGLRSLIAASFVGLTLLPLAASAQSRAPSVRRIEVRTQLDVVKVELRSACVRYVNSEGESSGRTFVFDHESFQLEQQIRRGGLGDRRLLNKRCQDLTNVEVPERARIDEVIRAVEAGGGFTSETFVFLDEARSKASFDAAFTSQLNALQTN